MHILIIQMKNFAYKIFQILQQRNKNQTQITARKKIELVKSLMIKVLINCFAMIQ